MQLATTVDSRRLVFTAGNFTILDVFDRNSVSWDPRQTFFNMAFMTHASWDFPSDARGYSWGGTAELFWDDWSVRYGRITPPQNPNELQIDFRLWEFYGDQVEVEHDHTLFGQQGAVRLPVPQLCRHLGASTTRSMRSRPTLRTRTPRRAATATATVRRTHRP